MSLGAAKPDRCAVLSLRVELGDKSDVQALRLLTDLLSRLQEADIALEQIEFEDNIEPDED
jgi:hypothetical protein